MRAFARRLMQAMTLFWLGMAAWMLADAVQELMRGRATHAAAAAAYSLAWVWLFRAWLVCERQSRVYARHDARDRADAAWNALQPPVAAGAKVWHAPQIPTAAVYVGPSQEEVAARQQERRYRCYGGPAHGHYYSCDALRVYIPFRTDSGFGRALYERSGDVLLCIDPKEQEAA